MKNFPIRITVFVSCNVTDNIWELLYMWAYGSSSENFL